ncbi:OB-fold nucleic acid binding domain-containing protein [Halobellus captivus]|uniref:OB-fold nucleic acid binding domain-containing protein n=1 Tax=Halobellus captivus TaxID=2592614 RepID=UPI0011AA84C8|nr:OB-fold nucleic acid binding domain-containing protein [Halobellus captivus]
MGAIEDVYEDLDTDVDFEEFEAAVEDKVEQMGGLADEETAAMLIAHELRDEEVEGIADVAPGMNDVKFLAKVMKIGDLRTFERDGEDEDGKVINVDVADESGRIRITMWDGMAEDAVERLETGQVLRVAGRPKDGYNGIEVDVDKVEPAPDAEVDVQTHDSYRVEDLALGLSDVNLKGRVLSTDTVRTFDRDDGSEGQVRNVRVKDETGDIRVALWGEKADLDIDLADYVVFTDVEVQDGWQDDLEASAGWQSTVSVMDDAPENAADTETEAAQSTGLGAFESSGSETGTPAASTSDAASSGGSATAAVAERPEESDGPAETETFTGTVVQAGNPVVLDDGSETRSVKTDESLRLGEKVTVSGTLSDGTIAAEDVERPN